MRVIYFLAGAALLSGCNNVYPTHASQSCDQASHALRVHDSKIEAARRAGTMGFTVTLGSRGYTTYHCVTTSGNQVACSTIAAGVAREQSVQVARLMRERDRIEARVARACQI